MRSLAAKTSRLRAKLRRESGIAILYALGTIVVSSAFLTVATTLVVLQMDSQQWTHSRNKQTDEADAVKGWFSAKLGTPVSPLVLSLADEVRYTDEDGICRIVWLDRGLDTIYHKSGSNCSLAENATPQAIGEYILNDPDEPLFTYYSGVDENSEEVLSPPNATMAASLTINLVVQRPDDHASPLRTTHHIIFGGVVTEPKVASDAIDRYKLAEAAVTNDKLADDAVLPRNMDSLTTKTFDRVLLAVGSRSNYGPASSGELNTWRSNATSPTTSANGVSLTGATNMVTRAPLSWSDVCVPGKSLSARAVYTVYNPAGGGTMAVSARLIEFEGPTLAASLQDSAGAPVYSATASSVADDSYAVLRSDWVRLSYGACTTPEMFEENVNPHYYTLQTQTNVQAPFALTSVALEFTYETISEGAIPPDVPELVSPAADTFFTSDTTPLLRARFYDTNEDETGRIEFRICSDPNCSTIIASGNSDGGLANYEIGEWEVSSPLADGVFYWRARAVDSATLQSSWTQARILNMATTQPTVAIDSITPETGGSYQYASGSSVWFNPAESGSFTVSASGDGGVFGIDYIDFPTLGSNWTGGGREEDPANSTPIEETYTWSSGAAGHTPATVTIRNVPGLSTSTSFSVIADETGPSGGTASYPTGTSTETTITVTGNKATDAGAGIENGGVLERRTAAFNGSSCETWDSWLQVDDFVAGGSYSFEDTDLGSGCYQYRYKATDRVANTSMTTPGGSRIVVVPPQNTALPTISGQTQDTRTLTADPGTWTGMPPLTYTYQWKRCDTGGSNCSSIGGATSASYVATADDIGSTLRVQVTATDIFGETSASSGATSTITGRPPENTQLPAVTGTTTEGQLLTATPGSWVGTTPITTGYQWQRCGYSGVVLGDAPVGYWRLEETSGTSASDSSGYAQTGTFAGGYSRGVTGLAAGSPYASDFLGVNGTVSVADTATLSPTAAVTMEAIVQLDTLNFGSSNWKPIILKDQAYQLRVENSSGQPRFRAYVYSDGSWRSGNAYSAPISTGLIYHVAATFDGSTITLYVNGASVGSGNYTGAVNNSASSLTISHSASDNTVDGRIDEVAIYDEALSASELAEHALIAAASTDCANISGADSSTYTLQTADADAKVRVAVTATNSCTSGCGSDVAYSEKTATVAPRAPVNTSRPVGSNQGGFDNYRSGDVAVATSGNWSGKRPINYTYQWQRCDASYQRDVLDSSPVLYWRFEETSGTSLTNYAGNLSGEGTLAGGAVLGSAGLAATSRYAPDFTGTDPRAYTASYDDLNPTAAVSVEAWVEADSLPPADGDYRTIALKSQQYWLRVNNVGGVSKLGFYIYSNGAWQEAALSSAAITTGTVYHVAGTFDGTTLRVYLNGALAGSYSYTGALNTTANEFSASQSGSSYQWDGRIDEVAVYGSAVAEATLLRHYQLGSSGGSLCTDISGASSATYTLTGSDVGKYVRARVVGSNTGGDGASAYTETLGPVAQTQPTIAKLSGFEAATFDAAGSGLFDTAVGPESMSAETQAVRSGLYSARMSPAGAYTYTRVNSPSTDQVMVSRFGIYLDTVPGTAITLAGFYRNTGGQMRLKLESSTRSLIEVTDGTITTKRYGPSLQTGQWYLIEMRFDISQTPWRAEWRVNGVEQPGMLFTAGVPQGEEIAYTWLGTTSSGQTFVAAYDDWAVSATATDYPLGYGGIDFLYPNGNGTHSNGTTWQLSTNNGTNTSSFDGNSETTSWPLLDDWPVTTGGGADLITPTSTTGYAQYALRDIPGASPVNAVKGIVAVRDSSAGANNIKLLTELSGSTSQIVSADPGATLEYRAGLALTDPGSGAWSQTDVNALQMRVSSTDVSPQQLIDAVLVEVDRRGSLPVATTRPSVSGTAQEGQLLSGDAGAWTGSPSISYKWLRCDASGFACAEIVGATNLTYTAAGADVDKRLRFAVVAAGSGGSSERWSAATSSVLPIPPVNTAAPVITNQSGFSSNKVGDTLATTNGEWTSSSTPTFTYQWQRCDAAGANCSNISGATGQSYTLTVDDAQSTPRVKVTATNPGGSTDAYSQTSRNELVATVPAGLELIDGFEHSGLIPHMGHGTYDNYNMNGTTVWERSSQNGRCYSGGGLVEIVSSPARSGSGALKLAPNGGTDACVLQEGWGSAAMVVRLWWRVDSGGSNTEIPVFGLSNQGYDPDDSGGIYYDATIDRLYAVKGSTRQESSAPIIEGEWYLLEARFAAGSLDWRVNNAAQTSIGSITTGQYYTIMLGSRGGAGSYVSYYDNVALSAVSSNYPLGNGVASTLFPNGPGPHASTSGWSYTTNSGSNWTSFAGATETASYATIDDQSNFSATDGLKTTTNGSEALYTLTDLAASTPLQGLQLTASGYWSSCSSCPAKLFRLANTSYDYSLSSKNVMSWNVWSTVPGGGSWTVQKANDLVVGARIGTTATGYVSALNVNVDQRADPPVNTIAPSVYGPSPLIGGSNATANPGSWTGASTLGYQWQRCTAEDSGCSDISGATSQTYTVASADAGKYLRVKIVGSNATGAAYAYSSSSLYAFGSPTNLRYLTGFETGNLYTQSVTTPNETTTGTVTVSSSIKRSGAYSMRAQGGASNYRAIATSYDSTSYEGSLRFGFYAAALPNTEVAVLRLVNGTTTVAHLKLQPSGQLTAAWTNADTVQASQSGPIVSTGQWYLIELGWNRNINPRLLDWRVNGVAQPQVSYSTTPYTTVLSVQLGHMLIPSSSSGADFYFDDVLVAGAYASHPLGDGEVTRLLPDGDGTHANSGYFATSTGSTWPTLIDEIPFGTTTDYFQQQNQNGTPSYIETTFTNPASAFAANGVHGVVSYNATMSNTSSNCKSRIVDGSGTTIDDLILATPSTTLKYRSQLLVAPSGGWTPALLDALKARNGYCTSVTGTPRWQTLVLEADGMKAAPTASVSPAITPSSGLRAGDVATVSNGTWSDTPSGYSYQWQRCDTNGTNCADIPGETSWAYTLSSDDVGMKLRARVHAQVGTGTGVAVSDATAAIAAEENGYQVAVLHVNASGDDGTVTRSEGAYPPGGSGTVATATTSGDWVAKSYSGGTYTTRIGLARFATSSLPANAAVVSAKFRWHAPTGGSSADSRNLNVEWYDGSLWPIDAGDGGGGVEAQAASIGLASISGGSTQLNAVTLSEATANVSKTGYTGLRFGVSGSQPSAVNDAGTISFYDADSSTPKPTLVVYYTTSSAPVNTAAPTLTPTSGLDPGETVTINSDGSWTGAGYVFTYQWQRCDTGLTVCDTIFGEAGTSYTLGAADAGMKIRALVRATNGVGYAEALTDATETVSTPTGLVRVTIPIANDTDDGYAYGAGQYYPITYSAAGTTGETIPVGRLYYYNGSCPCNYINIYDGLLRFDTSSLPDSAAVASAELRFTSTGVSEINSSDLDLTADWYDIGAGIDAADWNQDASTSAHTGVDLTDIDNATNPTGQLGLSLPTSVSVTGNTDLRLHATEMNLASYTTNQIDIASREHTVYDEPRLVITYMTQAPLQLSSPAIGPTMNGAPAGTLVPTDIVYAETGNWVGQTSFTYQWQRCDSDGTNCANISGATGQTYTVADADVTKSLRVQVTATNAYGSTQATTDHRQVPAGHGGTAVFEIATGAADYHYSYTGTGWPPSTSPAADGASAYVYGGWRSWDKDSGLYSILVGLLRWDTSSLPDGATITGAALRFHNCGAYSFDGRNLTAEWYDFGVIDSSDFTSTVGTSAHSGASIATLAGSLGGYTQVVLENPASISKVTYSGLRTHVAGGAPEGLNEWCMTSYEHSIWNAPRLIVTYTP